MTNETHPINVPRMNLLSLLLSVSLSSGYDAGYVLAGGLLSLPFAVFVARRIAPIFE